MNDPYDNGITDREALDRFGKFDGVHKGGDHEGTEVFPHKVEDCSEEFCGRPSRTERRARVIDPDIAAAVAELGSALTRALLGRRAAPDSRDLLRGALGASGYRRPADREMALIGYSPELKALIVRAIELNPVGEELILLIAETAFAEGTEEGE
jgi:hypothetical protein